MSPRPSRTTVALGLRAFPGGGIVAIVDPRTSRVVTVYANVIETALRPDQTDADALRFARKRT